MNYDNYQKLKDMVKNRDFFTNYKGLSKTAYYISYIGNLFSIIFAYFHVNRMISDAMIEPNSNTILISVIITILILVSLEFIKRFVFDKFSVEFIKQKFKLGGLETNILALVSICLVSASFYLSLNGAKDFSSRNTEIKDKVETNIKIYEDSLKVVYDNKIALLDSASDFLSKKKLEYETKSEEAETNKDIKYYRGRIKENDELIDKNDIKIKEIKNEFSIELSNYKNKLSTKGKEKIVTNEGNSIRFVVFSTIFEFIILFGIFFNNFYVFKSVSDFENKINKDPRYKSLNNYNELVSFLYSKDTKVGDTIPTKVELAKILRINNIDLYGKELDNTLKIFTHLGILQKRGPKKAIKVDEETARELIKTHLKID